MLTTSKARQAAKHKRLAAVCHGITHEEHNVQSSYYVYTRNARDAVLERMPRAHNRKNSCRECASLERPHG